MYPFPLKVRAAAAKRFMRREVHSLNKFQVMKLMPLGTNHFSLVPRGG